MTTGELASGTETARERADYAGRIRRNNERMALTVGAIFALTGVLPMTQPENRAGVLYAALAIFALTLVWFRLVPATALGDRRVLVFSLLAQPIVHVLLGFTGGIESVYRCYAFLLVLVTVNSPRTSHTAYVGAATAASLVGVAILTGGSASAALVAERLATALLQLLVFGLFTAFSGRALREARRAITLRAEGLAGERATAINLAFTDALTGLYNRRYAEDLLTRLVSEAGRGRLFSVLALDLDGLKTLNDTLGHATGDRVIARIAELLKTNLRGADVPIRVGGDEFLALLPGTRRDQADLVGERLRAAIRDADWSTIGLPITVSVGVAEWRDGQSGADVVNDADARLYEAKRARRAA